MYIEVESPGDLAIDMNEFWCGTSDERENTRQDLLTWIDDTVRNSLL